MKIVRKIQSLFRRKYLEADMAEEMRHHLEEQIAANLRAGMSPEEARHAAQRQFGHLEGIKEEAREQRALVWLDQIGQDLHYALRQFARAPGFAVVVIATLALGIGATTAIFSVVNAVILNPVPGPDSDRVLMIGERNFVQNQEMLSGVSPPVLEALQAHPELFEALTWYDTLQLERQLEDFATFETGSSVGPNFFALLDGKPLLGRTFAVDETVGTLGNQPEQDGPMVISHAWWQALFGGDPEVLGKTVELGDRRFTVVGVMPAHFRFPYDYIRYWLPAAPMRPRPSIMRASNTQVIVRLNPGVTTTQVEARLKGVAGRLTSDYPAETWGYGQNWRLRPNGLQLWHRPLQVHFQDGRGAEELRRTLFGLLAAISFVLLIVCANVANLTLARTERRQHELAVRAALGAGHARLMRQLLTESLLLALLGGLAGLIATGVGMNVLTAMNTMPRLRPVEVDTQVLGVALLVSSFSGILFGLAPAWRAGRTQVGLSLSQAALGAPASARRSGYRGGLVIVQVALTVALLTGAGLMLRSVTRALKVDPGFDPDNLVTLHLQFGGTLRHLSGGREARAAYLERRNAILERIHDRFSTLPGVKAVGLYRGGAPENVVTDGEATWEVIRVYTGAGSSDYFRAARIPLVAGRHFDHQDAGSNVGTVIVNESMARLGWPGEEAVGKTFRERKRGLGDSESRVFEVIGVVGDVRVTGFNEEVRPTFYSIHDEALVGGRHAIVVRIEANPGAMIAVLRRELKAADPDMMMPYITLARQVLFDSTQAQRTYRNYLLVFAAAGLSLSALGIYGVMAYAVVRRTREIGIRIAIGAGRRHVLGMILRDGVRLVGLGAAAGLLGAFWLTRFLTNQLFEVSPTDPLVLSGVLALLSLVALSACYLPARRATRVDPAEALRAE